MTYEQFVQVIMPSVFCPEDGKWIQEQLQQLSPSLRRKVVAKYAEVYQVAFYSEPVSFRQENKARHEANTRLRLFVKSHGKALQGYTVSPPLVVK
ncbi:TPA: hypothetical protein PXR45_002032 [Yersinia enterocolitica]|nr:hypothetical protein [Yersinia enterocolitica]HDM8309802.1 hypothetical protein [Yersinia enterocolitica]HDV7143395.1 hypothetical protein [Yersinia enterocolitica]HDY3769854.1 hypothetical protein [Yersinia enterocolitica]